MSEPRRRALAAGVVGLLALLLAAFVADGLGLTYDEPVYAAVGQRHLSWYSRLASGDLSALQPAELERHWGNSGPTPVEADWHPPLGKLWLALCRQLPLPLSPFVQYRLGSVLLFAATAAVLVLWLAEAAGLTAGVAAGLAWASLPRALAHGGIAALDLPVAFFATLTLWLGWRAVQAPNSARGVAFGVALGLACATKFNGVLAVLALLPGAGRQPAARRPLALGALVVAPLLFWALWPWLWYDGLRHLGQVVAFHGRHGYITTEYFGRSYADPPPPWHYPLVMLAISTPLATLLTAGAAGRRAPAGLLLAGLLCHLLPFVSPAAAKYNGVRLFLPALPLLAGLSGLGVARLVAPARRRLPNTAGWVAPAAIGLAVYLPAVVGVMQVYPYPMAYYGAVVGGAAGADRRGLEASYWGDPLRGALAWLSQPGHAAEQAEVYLHPPGALAMAEMYRGLGLLRPGLTLVSGPEAARRARYFVYQNRRSEWDDLGWMLSRTAPRQVMEAAGAPVAFIWERQGD